MANLDLSNILAGTNKGGEAKSVLPAKKVLPVYVWYYPKTTTAPADLLKDNVWTESKAVKFVEDDVAELNRIMKPHGADFTLKVVQKRALDVYCCPGIGDEETGSVDNVGRFNRYKEMAFAQSGAIVVVLGGGQYEFSQNSVERHGSPGANSPLFSRGIFIASHALPVDLAHEIGHSLGRRHVSNEPKNLMCHREGDVALKEPCADEITILHRGQVSGMVRYGELHGRFQ